MGKATATWEDIVKQLHELSDGTHGPSRDAWDAKRGSYPLGRSISRRFGISWAEIIRQAGLKPPVNYGGKLTDDTVNEVVSEMLGSAAPRDRAPLGIAAGKETRPYRFYHTGRRAWVTTVVRVGYFAEQRSGQ